MKWKFWISLICIFIVGILIGFFSTSIVHSHISAVSLKSVHVLEENQITTEKKIQEIVEDEKYKIRVYSPCTPYSQLNHAIDDLIQEKLDEFQQAIGDGEIPVTQYYSLEINYDQYEYKNYISYVFYIFMDTGGAHPNTYIDSVSYDKESKKIITISSLSSENPQILETLSTKSRELLKNSEKFKDDDYERIKDMIFEGTSPTLNNFRNFAFSENGLIIFFENYQVAPYVYGSFQITIPYEVLELNV